MKGTGLRSKLSSSVVLALLTIATAWASRASAQSILGLQGSRWEQPVITYWINGNAGVSDAAMQDVEAAISDWNAALALVADAPALQQAASARKAQIVIDLRTQCTRKTFGQSNPTVRGGYWSLPETSGCAFKRQHFILCGDALGQEVGFVGTRNVARHLLGEALGLGHSDCARDVMSAENFIYWGGYSPDVDLEISECDLAGVRAIYTSPTCADIPHSISCTCP